MSLFACFGSFLLGTATGAAATYFGTKYTDQRREQEQNRKNKQNSNKVTAIMTDFIKELRGALSNPETSFVRELVLLANNRVVFSPSKKCFILFKDRYQDLDEKIAILENNGYVLNISHDGSSRYKMTESFVGLVVTLGNN